MPRKTRATQKAKAAEEAVVESKSHHDGTTSPPRSPKGKQRQVDAQAENSSEQAAIQDGVDSALKSQGREHHPATAAVQDDQSAADQSDPASTASDTANQEEVASRATMEERKARMAALRKKMVSFPASGLKAMDPVFPSTCNDWRLGALKSGSADVTDSIWDPRYTVSIVFCQPQRPDAGQRTYEAQRAYQLGSVTQAGKGGGDVGSKGCRGKGSRLGEDEELEVYDGG